MARRDQLDPRDHRDHPALLVRRGKREIEEYSYEGLLDYKVQLVPSYFSGGVVSYRHSDHT